MDVGGDKHWTRLVKINGVASFLDLIAMLNAWHLTLDIGIGSALADTHQKNPSRIFLRGASGFLAPKLIELTISH